MGLRVWGVAKAHQDNTMILEAFTDQSLNRGSRIGILNINVERRHFPSQQAGALGVGECLGPNINFAVVGFGFGLPFVYRRDLAIHRDRREAGNAQLLAPSVGLALSCCVIVASRILGGAIRL